MVSWICDSTVSPDQPPAVRSTPGVDSVDSILRLGKWGVGCSVANRELTYCWLLVSQHTQSFPFRFSFFFFFLVIKTSSSFQTPYTQLGVSVYTGRQGFMSQRHTRSLGAATNRCRKCPLWPVYHPSAREQCWGCNPLKGWVCVLRGECYRAE